MVFVARIYGLEKGSLLITESHGVLSNLSGSSGGGLFGCDCQARRWVHHTQMVSKVSNSSEWLPCAGHTGQASPTIPVPWTVCPALIWELNAEGKTKQVTNLDPSIFVNPLPSSEPQIAVGPKHS